MPVSRGGGQDAGKQRPDPRGTSVQSQSQSGATEDQENQHPYVCMCSGKGLQSGWREARKASCLLGCGKEVGPRLTAAQQRAGAVSPSLRSCGALSPPHSEVFCIQVGQVNSAGTGESGIGVCGSEWSGPDPEVLSGGVTFLLQERGSLTSSEVY